MFCTKAVIGKRYKEVVELIFVTLDEKFSRIIITLLNFSTFFANTVNMVKYAFCIFMKSFIRLYNYYFATTEYQFVKIALFYCTCIVK